jgi:hypothetical protein
MNFLKLVALSVLVAVPFLLTKKEEGQPARDVDNDHIYDLELTVD